MNTRECYRVLGVSINSGAGEVRAAYRSLLKSLHPDLAGSEQARDRLERVITAYRTLCSTRPNLVSFPDSRPTPSDRYAPPRSFDLFELGALVRDAARPDRRAFAIRCLANTRKRAALGFIKQALFDESDIVVKEAVKALRVFHVHSCSGELAAVYHHGSEDVRREVLISVERSSSISRFATVLRLGMQDQNPELRSKATRLFTLAKRSRTAEAMGSRS